MIGNNSCGTHSLLGGKTVDNVEELRILLYDGSQMTVGATSGAEFAQIISQGDRRSEIYRKLYRIQELYAGLIRERFPQIPRRVSGYNLDELLPERGFNLARALVGTEGTCAIALEAKLKLIHSPQHRALVGLGYPDAFFAADHVPEILRLRRSGLKVLREVLSTGSREREPKTLIFFPRVEGFCWWNLELMIRTKLSSSP